MARTKTSAVSNKVYHHFAAVTLAVTATLALFAEGESRNAASPVEQIADEGSRTEEAAEPKLELAQPSSRGWAPDPVLPPAMATQVVAARTPSFSAGLPLENLESAGFSRAYLEALNEEERLKLIEGLEQSGMLNAEQRQRQSSLLLEASARRSGAAATGA